MSLRIFLPGKPPMFRDDGIASGTTAGDAIKAAGGDPSVGAISVNGKLAAATTGLQPGDSVRQSPYAENG